MNNDRLLACWWLLLAASALVMRLISEGIIDTGDAIQHYHIARASWEEPVLLFDHWGKPLFTLLSSPFAQLGLWGMTAFNALCFLGTCWAADGMLRSGTPVMRWVFAPLLILMPEYGKAVLAGLTEPLFGMLALLVLRSLHEQRWAAAALITSLMPFARPEYAAVALFVALWFIVLRQWRALPLLFVGHAIYGLSGWAALGDPIWYINRAPYQGVSEIYGHGEALRFIRHLPQSFGWPVIVGVIVGTLAGMVLWKRHAQMRRTLTLVATIAFLPSIIILLVHSVLWWKGLRGSLGLTRVLATAAPLTAVAACWPISMLVLYSSARAAHLLLVAAMATLAFSSIGFFSGVPLPYPADANQRFLWKAGAQVNAMAADSVRVVYFNPMIAFAAGLGPYDPTKGRQCWGLDESAPAMGLAPDELLVWDAHFGPNEGRTALERLLQRDDLEPLSLMVPDERIEVLGGHPFEVWVFRPGLHSRRFTEERLFDMRDGGCVKCTWHADTMECMAPSGGVCLSAVEYPFELRGLDIGTDSAIYAEVRLESEFHVRECDAAMAWLVFAEQMEEKKLTYWSWPVRSGKMEVTFRIPRRDPSVRRSLYLWNLHRCSITVSEMRLSAVSESRSVIRPVGVN